AVDGDFDDCQAVLKALFADAAFAREVDLSAVNSINFVRLAAQIVYYFTVGAALGAPRRTVDFAVPTGNFGDAFAAWAAWEMGLPMEKILVATNVNNVVARALAGGRLERTPVVATQSPAMDIQAPSNFERLYFEFAERNGAQTGSAFRDFTATGYASVRDIEDRCHWDFEAITVSEAETSAAIADNFTRTGMLVDPHTAVALAAANMIVPMPGSPLVVLATAHPAKFPDAVHAATGVFAPPPPAIRKRADLPERFERLPADAEVIKAYVRAFAAP
ncbi:MAG: pyridoxal-phosphate dependent enzyme, partial [Caulobacteraceae bacterium]